MASTATRPRKTPGETARPVPAVRETAPASGWISPGEAAHITQRSHKTLKRMAAAGFIRAHEVPGLRTRYWAPDVEKYRPPSFA